MTDYYMLECFEPLESDHWAGVRAAPRVLPRGISWTMGRRFPGPLPDPLEFEMFAHHGDHLLELYHEDAIIITRRLLDALLDAGVDNLDVYPAVIRHPRTGFVTRDHVAANLVGLVSAADLARSRVLGTNRKGLIDVDFDSVAIDEEKAADLLMFRLAESTNAIVVHERVRQRVLAAGIETLTFMSPGQWMG